MDALIGLIVVVAITSGFVMGLKFDEQQSAQRDYCARQGMVLIHGYCLTPEETISRRARADEGEADR